MGIETLVATMVQIYEFLVKKLPYGLRKVGVETVNETMREISTDLGHNTWQHTRKAEE